VRFVSPVLLKTALPRPAPGQAPAERIISSIARSSGTSNCSGSGLSLRRRPVLTLSRARQHRGVAPSKAIRTSDRTKQQKGESVFLDEGTAPGSISVRTAAVRTLILAPKHSGTSKYPCTKAQQRGGTLIISAAHTISAPMFAGQHRTCKPCSAHAKVRRG